MRTTLTIDDNIAAALKKRAYESGKSFKQAVTKRCGRSWPVPCRQSIAKLIRQAIALSIHSDSQYSSFIVMGILQWKTPVVLQLR